MNSWLSYAGATGNVAPMTAFATAFTPFTIFVYLLVALYFISKFERKTRKELQKVKEHLISVEAEIGRLIAPPKPETVPADDENQ